MYACFYGRRFHFFRGLGKAFLESLFLCESGNNLFGG